MTLFYVKHRAFDSNYDFAIKAALPKCLGTC